jgi:hypothetical protein
LSNTISNSIDIKNKDELSQLYLDLTQKLFILENEKVRLKSLQGNHSVSKTDLSAINDDFEHAKEKVNFANEQISNLRQKIENEKNIIDSKIISNDGLMTNIMKTVDKNKYMLILISIFICAVVLIPTQIEIFFTAGLYEHLIEYNNHINLAKRGIAAETNRIFVDGQIHYQPKYLYPEEILRQKKTDLNHDLLDNIKNI